MQLPKIVPPDVIDPADPNTSAAGLANAVTVADVRFSYGRNLIFDGISLSVPAGSIIGIVGPSGCGKSTLLSLIAGLLEPDQGSIDRVSHPGRHPLSMMFQRDTLLPWLTAADNVRLFTRFRKHGLRGNIIRRSVGRGSVRGSRELDDRVAELLELAGLAASADKYPYQLSGGMRRRLAFLTAVAAQPELLLLDEPFSSVDEPTRIGIHQDAFEIARRMRMTTILVTHDLAEAISLCDRILILRRVPSVVVHTHEIPFGEERKMLEIRETSEYLAAYARLWHDLSEQIAIGRAAEDEEARS